MTVIHNWSSQDSAWSELGLLEGKYHLDNDATAARLIARIPAVTHLEWRGAGDTPTEIIDTPAIDEFGYPEGPQFEVTTPGLYRINRLPGNTTLTRED